MPEESHGQRSLAGSSPLGYKESDRAENAHTHTSTEIQLDAFKPAARKDCPPGLDAEMEGFFVVVVFFFFFFFLLPSTPFSSLKKRSISQSVS